ncbi:MAG: hypothetical protein ABG776_12530 [Cyanobacteria bacterium J06555_13]
MLDQLRSDKFVGPDSIEIEPGSGELVMRGEIGCKGGILIDVEKTLAIISGWGDEALVETVRYKYNVSLRGLSNILRYDNQDEDFSFRKNHADRHHKHVFDWRTGIQQRVEWVGADNWPKLNQVIEEMREWYGEHMHELKAQGYPALGLR